MLRKDTSLSDLNEDTSNSGTEGSQVDFEEEIVKHENEGIDLRENKQENDEINKKLESPRVSI